MSRPSSWRAAGGALARAAFVASALALSAIDVAGAQPTFALVHGRWWQDGAYRERTYYMSSGVLRAKRPAHVDGTIDLRGLYVLPAPSGALAGPCSEDVARGALGTRVAWRRPSRLADGAAASFVALRGDPRHDVAAFADVALRVRRGCVLW